MNVQESQKKNRKKLNAVDWFLILAILLCIVGAVLRMLLGSESGSFSTPVVEENYIISFKISNIRHSSTEYLKPDEKFYMNETDQYFGHIVNNVSVTPARFYISDAEGNYMEAYAPENGDATRVDVTGTMLVSGYMSENGFLLGSTTPLAINKEIALRSSFIYVTLTITDIAKAS